MSENVKYFVDGLYSAFSFDGKNAKINKRAKKTSHYSSSINTNTNINLKKSITRVSISIKDASSNG